MDAVAPTSASDHDQRPLLVRSQNVLIDRWHVALSDDPDYHWHLDEAMLRSVQRGIALPYANEKPGQAELRRRAITERLRRLGAPVARSSSLVAVHGWRGGAGMILTSWWMYRWSALLTDERTAMAVTIAYVLLLYTLLRTIRNKGSVLLRVAWIFLFAFWITVAGAMGYSSAPPVISSREAGHWLRVELPPHASRSAIMAFIARHLNTNQSVTFDTIGGEHWITVGYLHQGWLDWCPPDVLISFGLEGDRLVTVEVDEQQTCS